MAPPKIFFKSIIFIFLIISFESIVASPSDLKSLMNVLSQRYGKDKLPVVVVLNSQGEKDTSQGHVEDSLDYSDERTAAKLSHLLQHDMVVHPKKLLPLKKTTLTPAHLRQKQKQHKINKLRADRPRSLEDKVLRSPIVKRLLRISNNIQCEAKNACQHRCNNKFIGKMVIKCEIQCEENYECEEEEIDPCDDGECQDSCGGSVECAISTKGEQYVTEEPVCKRC